MRFPLFKILLILVLNLAAFTAQAQTFKFEELITLFTDQKYPEPLFAALEERSYYRVDKQWLPQCDRVIYAFDRGDKPSQFVNPMNCFKPQVNTHYPMRYKFEMELQFQRTGRPEFDKLRAQIKKQCKLVTVANITKRSEEGTSSKPAKAYLHEASGVTVVIEEIGPVAFIYFIR